MKRMWSPWRSFHLRDFKYRHGSPEGSESIFSRISTADRDDENLVLWRGQHVFIVMNLYPYNNGHLLIVPYREVADYLDLTAQEKSEIAEATEKCLRWLRAALDPDGFNVGMNIGEASGAGIPEHLHVHVVPRWSGDTNFMPTVADVKVVPEALEDSFRRIQAVIGGAPPGNQQAG